MNQERREKAIAWIKEEIRSLERAPELNGCQMTPEWAAQLDIMRTCLEAVNLSDFAEFSKQVEREYYAGFSSNTAHIDREAWEPCELCETFDEIICQFSKRTEYDQSTTSKYVEARFCPKCGRPLTEEAWAMLEKRLRVTNP